MRRVSLEKLWLMSNKERKARIIKFDPKTTVVRGENSTGKSCLIKNIYHTLGADVKFHRDWIGVDAISLLQLSIDGKQYKFLRHQGLQAVLDKGNKIIHASSVGSDNRNFIRSLFSFSLKLTHTSSKESRSAFPSFQYLPYYIDQDYGWTKPWASFDRLSAFSNWPRDFIDYHTGIKPKEWYDATSNLNKTKILIADKEAEVAHLRNAQKSLNEVNPPVSFNINFQEHKEEINRLLEKCQRLKVQEDEYRVKLLKLKDKELHYSKQLKLATANLRELEKDIHFASKEMHQDPIECPTCGSEFENSLISRFGLIEDAETCREVMTHLRSDMDKNKKSIEELEKKYHFFKGEGEEIEKLLQQKKGDLKLKDILHSESQKRVRSTFTEAIDGYDDQLGRLYKEREDLIKLRKELSNTERSKSIKERYNALMQHNLHLVGVNIQEKDYTNLPTTVSDTGSVHPRLLMAYRYAILETIREFGSEKSCFFPIVVDSPNQQDQDTAHVDMILNFTLDKRPIDSQLVLGTVDLHGVDYSGYILDLTDYKSLLNKSDYDSVYEYLDPLLSAALLSSSKQ